MRNSCVCSVGSMAYISGDRESQGIVGETTGDDLSVRYDSESLHDEAWSMPCVRTLESRAEQSSRLGTGRNLRIGSCDAR